MFFGQQGAARRINTKVNEWKSKLLLPGTQVPWLRMTKDGRFLRNACAKYSPDTAVPLSDTGMQATVFTRLGTFKSHAKSGKHFKAAAAMANDVQPGAVDTLEAGHLQIVWNDLRKKEVAEGLLLWQAAQSQEVHLGSGRSLETIQDEESVSYGFGCCGAS